VDFSDRQRSIRTERTSLLDSTHGSTKSSNRVRYTTHSRCLNSVSLAVMQSLARHNIKVTLLVGAFHGIIPNDAYWSANPPNTTYEIADHIKNGCRQENPRAQMSLRNSSKHLRNSPLNGSCDTRDAMRKKQDRSHENLGWLLLTSYRNASSNSRPWFQGFRPDSALLPTGFSLETPKNPS
jgi:hypothetical protein